ncbi:TlpA family protein disulfide reductase [Pedobacter africanus]|uniref:Thiol-disulfide isomerase or thioredoxin n=1 Tax=Pedobacter africanus TaxID=151894 RepID=A0A1W2DLY9_9SPHI|nr:TlpA disulfide reductase family protein [Pedobacter africanus]SMC98048.1 Thiol-disulfide isomerase or thioredoxin [Pedobacter africanus]
MKLLLKLILVLVCFQANAQKNKLVTLKGHLKNFTNREWVRDFSEMVELRLPVPDREIKVDSTGYFSMQFPLSVPNYFLIGRNLLYLSPGDNLTIEVDYLDFSKARFEGKGSKVNKYLVNVPWPKSASYLDGGRNLKNTLKKSIDTVLLLANERTLKLSKVKGASKSFKKLEAARIRADIINTFRYLPGYFIAKYKIPQEKEDQIYKEFDALVQSHLKKYTSDFIDSDFLKIEVYRKNVYGLHGIKTDSSISAKKINDWIEANRIYNALNSVVEKEKLISFKPLIAKISNENYRFALDETYKLLSKFGKGDTAIDFNMFNLDGNNVYLSSFKGKTIIIDLWATWCGPCLEEMPYFDLLKDKYKNNDQITFISLCVNDEKSNWIKNVKSRNINGIQLFAAKGATSDYRIMNLPRTIIIDKDFKIAEMFGPRPSEKALDNYISRLVHKE